MDYVFLLGPEARRLFLRRAARSIGCSYICLWSYLPHRFNLLISMDGWYYHEDTGQPSSSSASVPGRLFDAYRASYCTAESRRVPGWASKEGLPYIELGESDLMNSASLQVQRQFYEEAGIKMAVFMRCESGEIEFGTQTSSNTNMPLSIQNCFSDDSIQQFQLGEMVQTDLSRPSSSSSSLRSFSVGSPEYSSLIHSAIKASFLPEKMNEPKAEQATQPMAILQAPPQPHRRNMQNYNPYSDKYPASGRDDAAMTRAMLAVISSSTSTSPPPSLLYLDLPQQDHDCQSRMKRWEGAFRQYSSALADQQLEFNHNQRNRQKIIKRSISLLRKINAMRLETQITQQEAAGPISVASNQLHHMISERKRREKLNERFLELRQLLPPGSKKDKASVLANTKNYLNTLKAKVSELEERNQELEAQILPSNEATSSAAGDSSENIVVQITRASESTSEVLQVTLRIIARVECDMSNLVLRTLECLKEMRTITLKSVDASTYPPQSNIFAHATLAIQVKGTDWDEDAFKEAVSKAVVDAGVGQPHL